MKFVDGTPDAITKSDHKLARLKRDTTLAIIPRFYNGWVTASKDEKMELQFYPTDICQKNINTHILFYEGVGDILLRGVKNITMLNIPNKYNSIVDFCPFTVQPQKRSDKFDKHAFHTMMDAVDTKSTNAYRSYRNIILLGDWNTPEHFASSVREAFKSDTTIEDYRVWYYTQLICRIGIRNLSGGNGEVGLLQQTYIGPVRSKQRTTKRESCSKYFISNVTNVFLNFR